MVQGRNEKVRRRKLAPTRGCATQAALGTCEGPLPSCPPQTKMSTTVANGHHLTLAMLGWWACSTEAQALVVEGRSRTRGSSSCVQTARRIFGSRPRRGCGCLAWGSRLRPLDVALGVLAGVCTWWRRLWRWCSAVWCCVVVCCVLYLCGVGGYCDLCWFKRCDVYAQACARMLEHAHVVLRR